MEGTPMKNVMRCTAVLTLSALLVLPWQHVDVPMADEPPTTPLLVLPDPDPSTRPVPPPITEDGKNAAGGTVTCDAGEWLNEAGDGCDALPTMEVTEYPTATCMEQGLVRAEDGSCVPPDFYTPPITEDSPEWDCRTMGNLKCGVVIEGQTYIIRFENGQPVEVLS